MGNIRKVKKATLYSRAKWEMQANISERLMEAVRAHEGNRQDILFQIYEPGMLQKLMEEFTEIARKRLVRNPHYKHIVPTIEDRFYGTVIKIVFLQ